MTINQPTGILSKGDAHKEKHVTIDAPNAKERGAGQEPIEEPPNPDDITAPKVDAPIKDEVELLRSGVINKV